MQIERHYYISKIKELLKETPVVALIGPRQVGKTTLARMIAAEYSEVTFFDLENPTSLSKLQDPLLALQSLSGLIIIDEIQHAPDLFKVLRFLVDQCSTQQNFLVLGSASPVLLSQSSESLAGRIAYVEVHGFSLQEVGSEHWEKLWLRGSFPRAYLASTEPGSVRWREEFIRTFLERDLPQLGIKVPAITMKRFWMMLAHYHGQIWNSSEFARAFGMSDKAVRHYLDILTSTFIVRQLAPWWENISKRQVKAPKIFLNDSGLLHTLLGLDTKEELASHPKVGASWEGFAMNTVLTQLNIHPDEAFFWSTYTGAELDLVVIKGNTRIGFEFKRSSAPQITKSVSIALKDLSLSHVYVIYVGNEQYPLADNITALGLANVLTTIKSLRD